MDDEVVPVLRVHDAARAVAWYRRLGFDKEWEHQFEPGFPWLVSMARGSARLYLSEHEGDARPDTLSTSTSATSTPCPPSSAYRSMKRASPDGSAISSNRTATGYGLRLGVPEYQRRGS